MFEELLSLLTDHQLTILFDDGFSEVFEMI